jgi:phenylalanyl-tRNA synthetase alpha chain
MDPARILQGVLRGRSHQHAISAVVLSIHGAVEVDIQCRRDKGEIRFGEGEDWLEILGCGMVHPNVLRACGIDPDVYQGFAWGLGIDRIAMLKYGMSDLRQLFESDVRWLAHYGFKPLDVPTLAGGLSS